LDDLLGAIAGDAPVREARCGTRLSAVWSRRIGVAYAFHREQLAGRAGGPLPAERLAGRSALELAHFARSRALLEASIGVAAISSLLAPPEASLRRGNAYKTLRARGAGADVTVVGHFPFVERLRSQVRNLWVLELDPSDGDLPAHAADDVVPRSDVVAITGTTLINGTLEHLLELARSSFVILLGPSTPLSPVLFDHGVDVLGGCVVTDPAAVFRAVATGVCLREAGGVEYVTLARDPT
jgi:hypothetical protein